MNQRRFIGTQRLGLMLALCALMLFFAAACGGDDDDVSATSTPGENSATATTSTAGSAGTPTSADAGEATATTAAPDEATATIASPDEATATTETSVNPTATSPAEVPTATSGSSDPTATSGDDPLADVETLDPEKLPNFSMNANIEVENTDETGAAAIIAIEIQQSSVDHYHIKFVTDDGSGTEELVETWQIGDRAFMSEEGAITELPPGTGSFFSPSLFLQQLPEIDDQLDAERIGEEDVSGRETTHYRASPENFLKLMQEDAPYLDGATDPEGSADIWIDNEFKIMIRARIDVSWTNTDGTIGRVFEEYDITDIGDTPEVSAPQ